MADILCMDLVNSIASFSAARNMAEVQMAVAAKIMQVSKDQGQQVVAMLSDAVETMQENIQNFASDLGGRIDTFA